MGELREIKGMSSMHEKIFYNGFLSILLGVGLVWLRSGIGKITGGKFVQSLGETLTKFASNNPHAWYKDILKQLAIPNTTVFGNVIMWGELLVSLLILTTTVYFLLKPEGSKAAAMLLMLGLVGGALLNLNFWLAAGWMSPSTDTLNLLMLGIEILGIVTIGMLLLKR